jgi:tRNA modification GTPase
MSRTEDTICAPATAIGGAISVIRISGPESLDIVAKIFFPSDKTVNLSVNKGFTIVHGDILADSEVIDEVLVSVFRSPYSYTGENSAEISCHASPYIVKKIIELLLKNGAIPALPGEFTRRAFMNGKIDLSQAEAVADVIASSQGCY